MSRYRSSPEASRDLDEISDYFILYRSRNSEIEIVRVVRGERDLPMLFSDDEE